MKRSVTVLALGTPLVGAIALTTISVMHYRYNAAPIQAVFVEAFEVDSLGAVNSRLRPELCCEDSAELTRPDGGNGNAVSFNLRPSDPNVKGSKRAEFRLPAGAFGTPIWYRSRILLPADWSNETQPVTILQWHGVPDKIALEGNRPPPLRLLAWNGNWMIPLNWDTSPISSRFSNIFGERRGTVLWMGPTEPGNWEDWVFRIVWTRRGKGRVSVWRAGKLVADYQGRTAYNDLLAPYLKFGIYVPGWSDAGTIPDTEMRTVMYDDVWEAYPELADHSFPLEVKNLIDTLSRDLER